MVTYVIKEILTSHMIQVQIFLNDYQIKEAIFDHISILITISITNYYINCEISVKFFYRGRKFYLKSI